MKRGFPISLSGSKQTPKVGNEFFHSLFSPLSRQTKHALREDLRIELLVHGFTEIEKVPWSKTEML